MNRIRIVGDGRAGGSFALALERAGWDVHGPLGREVPLDGAARDVDLLLICVSDSAVAEVAAKIEPDDGCVVAHVSGSLGLGELAGHRRNGAVHPLVSLATPESGADRLAAGAWFAVAGDPLVTEMVNDLGGRHFEVADDRRALYHAAACIASNHLVALLGQVERVAASAGAPFEAYLDLVRGTVENVAELGPAAALTGPAARGDQATIDRHLAALDEVVPGEREAYAAMVIEARRLVGQGA